MADERAKRMRKKGLGGTQFVARRFDGGGKTSQILDFENSSFEEVDVKDKRRKRFFAFSLTRFMIFIVVVVVVGDYGMEGEGMVHV